MTISNLYLNFEFEMTLKINVKVIAVVIGRWHLLSGAIFDRTILLYNNNCHRFLGGLFKMERCVYVLFVQRFNYFRYVL